MANLLETRDVRVRFRSKSVLKAFVEQDSDPYLDAVCGVSLNIEPGETFAVVGESGSGKTTLARAIAGLVDAQEGSITYQGQELVDISEKEFKRLRKDISMMFQDPIGSLSPRLKVGTLITEPYLIHKIAVDDIDAEARRLLTMVGLPEHFVNRYPFQLSGGQARRVGVARALALSPKLIIADEPTAGLDVSVQGEILNLLAELQKNLGLSLLIITHNLSVVRHISDRMGIMYLGRFVEQGTTDEIFSRPRHPYTQALLSANHDPDPDAELDRIDVKGEVPSLMQRPKGCEFHTRCPMAKKRCRYEVPLVSHNNTDGSEYSCHYPLS